MLGSAVVLAGDAECLFVGLGAWAVDLAAIDAEEHPALGLPMIAGHLAHAPTPVVAKHVEDSRAMNDQGPVEAFGAAAGPAARGEHLDQRRPRLGKAVEQRRRRAPGHEDRRHRQQAACPTHPPIRRQQRQALVRQKTRHGIVKLQLVRFGGRWTALSSARHRGLLSG